MLTFMKIMGKVHTFLFRLTRGKFGGSAAGGGNVLLLTTTGRKSGKKRTTPLVYIPHHDGYLVTGSRAGLDTHPDWYWNLRSNPNATIEIKQQRLSVKSEIISEGVRRDQLWQRFLGVADYFDQYARKTNRTIPIIFLKPVQE